MKITQKIFFIYSAVFIVLLLLFTLFQSFPLTGNIIDIDGEKITPLNYSQRTKVEQSILESVFIKDIPKNNPIFLRFFNFQNGERIWQDGFLVGKNQILKTGEPTIYFSIHSKYIEELNQNNLCEIVKKASSNGDVGIYSDYSKPLLFLKYFKLLKHRDCFGF